MSNTEQIRVLNDAFRTSRTGGRLVVTSGLCDRPDLEQILDQVTSFDSFNEDNDPYGEHDFGAFDHGDDRIFWKIDYYDLTMNFGSPDAANPDATTRVLTVMLANEY